MTFLVTPLNHKLQFFKSSPKWIIFGTFNEVLSTQNVNVARSQCWMRLFLWFSNTVFFVLGMESWWPVIPGFTFWPASSSHVPVRWASSASVGRTISCDFGTQLTRKPVVILLGYGRIILRIYVDTHSSFTLKMFFSPKLSKECTKLDKNYTLLWAKKMWHGAKHA